MEGEQVEGLSYMGSVMSEDSIADTDINARLRKTIPSPYWF